VKVLSDKLIVDWENDIEKISIMLLDSVCHNLMRSGYKVATEFKEKENERIANGKSD
jgi:hypothetical protein